jgi:hypothetical protein
MTTVAMAAAAVKCQVRQRAFAVASCWLHWRPKSCDASQLQGQKHVVVERSKRGLAEALGAVHAAMRNPQGRMGDSARPRQQAAVQAAGAITS